MNIIPIFYTLVLYIYIYIAIVSFLRNDSFAKCIWCLATNFSTESENFNKLSITLGDQCFQ